MLERRLLKRIDWVLLGSALSLQLFGLVAVASATGARLGDPTSFALVQRQFISMLIGWGGLYLAAIFDYSEFRRFARHIYVANISLLVAVLYVGERTRGAQRWINLGPMVIQPSELAKIFIIITLALHISRYEGDMPTWPELFWTLAHIAVPLGLIVRQPDLGTALVLGAIWLGMALIGGVPTRRLSVILVTSFLLVVTTLGLHLHAGLPLPLEQYQINRLIVFTDPDLDPTGVGYHLRQSIMAVGSGRLTGQGLFEGDMKRLHYLPDRHTEFIYAVIGEELGLRGVSILLLLFSIFLWRCLLVVVGAKDLFGALIATGVVSMFAFHIIVNTGMTLGLMPITGLPLPFISFGGSAILANSIALGLLVNVGIRRHKIMF